MQMFISVLGSDVAGVFFLFVNRGLNLLSDLRVPGSPLLFFKFELST